MTNRRRHRASQRGMMLIEILVVVTIMGMIAGVVGVVVVGVMSTAQEKTTQTQLSNVSQALDMYRIRFMRYPTTAQGLEALVRPPRGEVLLKAVPEDGWGQPFVFRCPGEKNSAAFDLYSKGPDGVEGTEDDVY